MARHISIVGFADSKRDCPWNDASIEKWVVNDLYYYMRGVTIHRIFEMHHTLNLDKRRNPEHEQFLRTNTSIPVYMQEHIAEYPGSVAFPRQQVMELLGTDYFTNSISWMIGLAITELCTEHELSDGRKLLFAAPDSKLSIYGVDMAADSEYGTQRPSCEYFVGVARALGIQVYIPPDSDLCKPASLYGYDTSVHQRVKIQSRIRTIGEQIGQLEQQQAQAQAQMQAIQQQIWMARGAKDAFKAMGRNWTAPVEAGFGEILPKKDRGPILELQGGELVEQMAVVPSDGQVPVSERS